MVVGMFRLFRSSRHRQAINEVRYFLGEIYGQNRLIISTLEQNHMAISKQVQDALDRIHQTQSLVQSVKLASDVQGQQISTLTDKVTELQAKIDGGAQIGPDDLAALSEIASDIDTVNAQLQSAIPANTIPQGDPKAPADSTVAGAQGGQQAQTDQIGAADGGPKPLAGTGAAGQ